LATKASLATSEVITAIMRQACTAMKGSPGTRAANLIG